MGHWLLAIFQQRKIVCDKPANVSIISIARYTKKKPVSTCVMAILMITLNKHRRWMAINKDLNVFTREMLKREFENFAGKSFI
jgi:cell division inhibitor SulA